MITFEPNEKVILMLRRHWIVFSFKIVFILILAAIPLIIYPFLVEFVPWFSTQPQLNILFILGVVYYMFTWLYFILEWSDYYLDVWIVTDRRVMDMEQRGLFSREVSEFSIHRIQDVTVEVTGIFPTIFHYGDVHVQTAGEARQFVFKDVHRPYAIKDKILKMHHEVYQKTRTSNF